MGFQTEFNWVLKLKPEQGLDEAALKVGGVYDFSKGDYRVYPIGNPIDLINGSWEAVGKVQVLEFTNKEGKTSGKYKLLKLYSGNEKEVLTAYWRESVEMYKGEKITDFSAVKMT